MDRLIVEMALVSGRMGAPLDTIFVGGGTPTLLTPAAWTRLGAAMNTHFELDAGTEFTIEANPETVTDELLAVLRTVGVNRMSIGAQSFDPRHLLTLERQHDPANVGRTVRLARAAGIQRISLDLIFGVPGQQLGEWAADLEAALALEPDHLSCYGLTYEPNTALTVRRDRGLVTPVDNDLEAAMYETTVERLAAAGFEQYEISNWARPGERCRHNTVYWENGDWWPFGPSAAGHVGGCRWRNVPRLAEYLGSELGAESGSESGAEPGAEPGERGAPVGLPPVVDVERLDDDGRVGEQLMLGLRLLDGIALARLEVLLGLGERGDQRRAAIDRDVAGGLLETSDERLRLTRRGLLLADSVLCDLI